jgi:Tfp pilus assembly protein PilZ
MSTLTSQQISRYYNLYKQAVVSFNTRIIDALSLLPREICLRCKGETFPCIIYSTSMESAKVLANLSEKQFKLIREANKLVSLRFCFKISEKPTPLAFFVTAKVGGFSRFDKANADLYFISLTYTQKPPDDLIEMLGALLDANSNARQRKEVRIDIVPKTIKDLNLDSNGAMVYIDRVPRKCIIRDLSFSGAKLLVVGVAKYLLDKEANLHLSFGDQPEPLQLAGKIIRYEEVDGRKEIAALAVHFHEATLPVQYKIRINDYLRDFRPGVAPA